MKSKIPDKASSASVSLTESMWYYLNGQPEGKSGYLQKLLRADMESSDEQLPKPDQQKCLQKLVESFIPAHAQIAENALEGQNQPLVLAKTLEALLAYLADRQARNLNPSLPADAYNVHIQFTGRPRIDLPEEFQVAADEPARYRAKKTARPKQA